MTTIIIAEAGVNHNGSLKLAKQMIDEAAKAGTDYIKFQTFKPEKLVSKYAQKADYQKKTTGNNESQLQMLEKLALSYDDFVELKSIVSRLESVFCPHRLTRTVSGFLIVWTWISGRYLPVRSQIIRIWFRLRRPAGISYSLLGCVRWMR